jgi:CxxC motif-containing protein (DUF1111 family)
VSRLLHELTIGLDQKHIQIYCDNKQTIRLVNEEIIRLQTRLRRVDIHNHWLRQEAQEGRIRVNYTPTRSMLADGLTKALSKEKFNEFCQQIGLVGLTDQFQSRKQSELPEINEEDLEIEEFQFSRGA